MDAVLRVSGLTKQYRNGRGVEKVSFEVRRGDVFGFFGPNGAGKTTVLKAIVGLLKPDRGEVQLFGQPMPQQFEQAMRKVGTLIETADSFDCMTARANLELVARFYPELGAGRIDEVLELVGLAPYQKEKVRGFSLGMKQRLALATTLLHRPELVILDEPTNGLDIEGMVATRSLIRRLAEEEGMSFVISSHMISEMEKLCNRFAIVRQGRLLYEGAVEDGMSLEAFYLQQVEQAKGA